MKEKSIKIEIEQYKVSGAGEIVISTYPVHMTGGSYGFGFGVSWGEYGAVGGVLGITEARKLANHILTQTEGIDEDQEKARAWERLLAK